MLHELPNALGLDTRNGGPVRMEYSMNGAATRSLTDRARDAAAELRRCLVPLIRQIVGTGLRPSFLARETGIDKTLAARLIRAIRATDDVTFLHEIPAPGGLRIFLEAAGDLMTELDRASTHEAISNFERLIDDFQGGRSALEAALSGLDGRVHQRTMRSAAQAINKSMTAMLGFCAEVMTTSIIITPSDDGRSVDETFLLGKYGVRRLRQSSPITMFGRSAESASQRDAKTMTLDGAPAPENGNAYLLTDFCSRPIPPLSLFRTESAFLYTLAATVPSVNEPVTMVAGLKSFRNSPRYRSEPGEFHWQAAIPRMPCGLMVSDIFVREDLWDGVLPTVTTTLQSIAHGSRRPDAPAFKLDYLDMQPVVIHLGNGLGRAAIDRTPRYPEMMASAFARTGLNPNHYRGYRCMIEYPVPLASLTFWFELPAAPSSPVSI